MLCLLFVLIVYEVFMNTENSKDYSTLVVGLILTAILLPILLFVVMIAKGYYVLDENKMAQIKKEQSTIINCFNRDTNKRETIESDGGFFYHKFDKRNYYVDNGELKSVSVVSCKHVR